MGAQRPIVAIAIWLLLSSASVAASRRRPSNVPKDSEQTEGTSGRRYGHCGDTHKVPYTPQGSSKSPLPEASVDDRCQGSKSLGDRFMITTSFQKPTAWMQKEISVPFFVYYAGGSNESHKHENVGNEAMGYLTFIAEYYNCLPEVMLFAHPHKSSYHTFQKLDQAVNMVQWENVPGFATVHPHGANWADFKPYDPVSNLEKPLLNVTQPSDVPCNQVFNDTAYDYWPSWNYRRAEYVSKAWDRFFGRANMGRMPTKIRLPTVAEFFVCKQRIYLHTRQFYLQAIQFIVDSRKADEYTDWELGVTFELLWHYIFGEPAYMNGVTVDPCTLYQC